MIETSHKGFFFHAKVNTGFLSRQCKHACAVGCSWQASQEPLTKVFYCRTKGSVMKHNCPYHHGSREQWDLLTDRWDPFLGSLFLT